MIYSFLKNLLLLSLSGGFASLLLILLSFITKKVFSPKWNFFSYKVILFMFIIPFFKFIKIPVKNKTTSIINNFYFFDETTSINTTNNFVFYVFLLWLLVFLSCLFFKIFCYIKFNKTDVSDKEIWKALEVVGVDHFVKSLPKTLDYKMEDNESISAGQKQLLTIARGMIKDAPFLILDEATSSVDTRTEELVQKAMDKLTEGRTSFIIAHRLSTIKNADIILVMKDGNIIETGSHDELMKKNGFYAELYNSQFQN